MTVPFVQRSASAAQLRQLLDSDEDWLYFLDDADELSYVSAAVERVTGYAPEAFLADRGLMARIVLAEDQPLVTGHREGRRREEPCQFEYRIVRRDGEVRWLAHACAAVFGDDGAYLGRRASNRDITDARRAELLVELQRDVALALSAATCLEAGMSRLLELVCRIPGLDCGGVYIVEDASRDLVLVAHRGLGESFVRAGSRLGPDTPQWRLVAAGKVAYGPYGAFRRSSPGDGDDEGLRALFCVPIMHEGALVGAINVSSHTVDELPFHARMAVEAVGAMIGETVARVRAETALAASEQDLRALFDTIDDLLFVLAFDGRILRTNSAVQRLLGYSEAELRTMHVLDVHPPDRREEAMTIVGGMLAGTCSHCPIPLQRKDGSLVPVETKVSLGVIEGKPALFGVSRDLTALRRAEERAAQLGRLLEKASHEIYVMDAETLEMVFVNEAARANLGYAPGEAGPRTPTDLNPALSRDRVLGRIRPLLRGEVDSLLFETSHHRRDGSSYPVEVVMQYAQFGDRRAIVGFAADVTERQRAAAALREHAQIKEALLREVNHRVKNNLATMLALVHRQEDSVRLHPACDPRTLFRDLETRIRALSIVHDLLSRSEWHPVPLGLLCANVIQSVLRASAEAGKAKVLVQESPVTVSSSEAHHVALVINELTINTIKHAGVAAGDLTIEIAIESSGDQVDLRYRDNGRGYPTEAAADRAARGTGMQLIHGIVRTSLRGTCEARNDAGARTDIRFRPSAPARGPTMEARG